MKQVHFSWLVVLASAFAAFDIGGCPQAGTTGEDGLAGLGLPGLTITDTDNDGLRDVEEATLGTDPTLADTDGDGLSDRDERDTGTDPTLADSDDDQLTDADELELGTNPLEPDSDEDGLNDGEEIERGTDPLDSDSDQDGLLDGDEIKYRSNPLNPDTDADKLEDGVEVEIGTSPTDADCDNDGLNDGAESSKRTDPRVADTDGDGLSDGDEVEARTNPLVADTDGDGLTDGTEVELGTDPREEDTDGDSLFDGTEVESLLDPLVPNEVGIVTTFYTSHAVVILASDLAVWFTEGTTVNFFLWQVGDIVVIARDPELPSVALIVNLTLADIASAIDYGLVVDDGYITNAAWDLSWVAVSGVKWYLNPYAIDDVYYWHLGDRALVTHNSASGLSQMINLTRGESVLLAP